MALILHNPWHAFRASQCEMRGQASTEAPRAQTPSGRSCLHPQPGPTGPKLTKDSNPSKRWLDFTKGQTSEIRILHRLWRPWTKAQHLELPTRPQSPAGPSCSMCESLRSRPSFPHIMEQGKTQFHRLPPALPMAVTSPFPPGDVGHGADAF